MVYCSFVSVPICDASGNVTRVVRIPLSEFGNLITSKGMALKAIEKVMGAVALD